MIITFKVKHKGSFDKRLTNMVAGAQTILSNTGKAVERKANSRKPDFVNILRNEIITKDAARVNIAVQTREDDMHAYYEFHTGAAAKAYLASADPEVRRIARTYFKTGRGTLRGQPYFYPSFFEEAIRYIEKLKKYVRARA
ncbi:MAG TPA: hypothetical protein VD907_06645 [Verrucomicrobiae bacterium]|nr:hypothetical protein [Verrucomicrobiae bacterium]